MHATWGRFLRELIRCMKALASSGAATSLGFHIQTWSANLHTQKPENAGSLWLPHCLYVIRRIRNGGADCLWRGAIRAKLSVFHAISSHTLVHCRPSHQVVWPCTSHHFCGASE